MYFDKEVGIDENKKYRSVIILCVVLLSYQLIVELTFLIPLTIGNSLGFEQIFNYAFHVLFSLSIILFVKQKRIGWMMLSIYLLLNLILFSMIFVVPLMLGSFLSSEGSMSVFFVDGPLLHFPASATLLIVDAINVLLIIQVLKRLNSKIIIERYKMNRFHLGLCLIISLLISVLLMWIRN